MGAAAFGGHRKGFLQHRHHAEPEEIHLDDAEILAVVLVPLHHRPARHGGVFQRHHLVEPPLANDHAPGVLTKMAWQAVDPVVKLDQGAEARVGAGDPGAVDLLLQLQRVLVIAAGKQAGKTRQDILSRKLSALPISRMALRPR